ncbi:MAG: amidohydrolase family protein [Trueperaceae bacterium]
MREIIDSHTHVDMNEAFGWFDPPESILELMDEAGIAKAVIMTYADAPATGKHPLEYIAGAVKQYPDRLIGFARMNPFYGERSSRLLEEALTDLRFKGLKIHQESITAVPYNPAVLELVRVAARHRAPVLFHTGDEAMSLPLQVARCARAAPEATIIMAHCGGYFHADEAIAVAEEYDNLMIDTSAIPYPDKLAEAVRRLGPQRVLFGSDGPGCNPALELRKLELAGLSERDMDLLLWENMASLLDRVKHD